MADLTAAADLRVLGEAYTEKWLLDTSIARTIYKGTPIMIDQSADTVNASHWVSTVTTLVADVFLGIAAENKSVTLAADQKTYIEVYTYPTILGFKSTVFTDGADNGLGVFMSDNATLVGVAGASGVPELGIVHLVKDGYCYVALNTPFICVNAT